MGPCRPCFEATVKGGVGSLFLDPPGKMGRGTCPFFTLKLVWCQSHVPQQRLLALSFEMTPFAI